MFFGVCFFLLFLLGIYIVHDNSFQGSHCMLISNVVYEQTVFYSPGKTKVERAGVRFGHGTRKTTETWY